MSDLRAFIIAIRDAANAWINSDVPVPTPVPVPVPTPTPTPTPVGTKWVSGYYPGWSQDYYPPSAIDFSAMTHVIHFAVLPRADGTLDDVSLGVTTPKAMAIVSAAHAAGKKVLITVGGSDTRDAFIAATSPARLPLFVANLVNLMRTRGYDGIDLDWEPVQPGDAAQITNLVNALAMEFAKITPRPLLTAAVMWQPALFAQLGSKFDQINLMTYYMSGPYSGWVTWHNSPLFNGGKTFPSTGGALPSIDKSVNEYLAAGVPLAKLGIGLAFHGEVWKGVMKPLQAWTTTPTMTGDVPYHKIMMDYQGASMAWDADAHVPYLSLDNANNSLDTFVSYDDERSLAEKVAYLGTKKLGGAIIWDITQGYRATQPTGQRDTLLQAVKAAYAKL